MLRLSIVVAATLLGTAAIAQDASSTAMPSDSSTSTPAAADSAAPGTATDSPASSAQSPDAAMTQGTAAGAGATKDYPRCSRTVTDSCIQGGARSRRR